jgi:hypothetical protein
VEGHVLRARRVPRDREDGGDHAIVQGRLLTHHSGGWHGDEEGLR